MQKKLKSDFLDSHLNGRPDHGAAAIATRPERDVWAGPGAGTGIERPAGTSASPSRSRLVGPVELSFDVVDRVLAAAGSGVFALGRVDGAGTFRVERVGRADHNLRESLKSLIGCGNQFKFAVTASAKEAFELECELFHRFRPPSTIIHPGRPPGSDWKCPCCTQLHL